MISEKSSGTPNKPTTPEETEAERPPTFEVSRECLANLPACQRRYLV
jgi:hypothetical protein